ncbi:MAG: TolC family protein [Desulfarculaceae bacterium]|nr:TolC family protein [Desulfarculaceae bacterium]MCF8070754.1 TolC family protein [Desulfarculaceae bacterium]MCF8102191.1 TolC family protein [Desulfarculaceae bacterium]MCF8117010.1 TolC family protein [Desulfarculaceae bacterium]
MLSIALIGLALLLGCAPASKYSYQSVKQERRAAEPAPSAAKGKTPAAPPEVKLPARLDLRAAIGLALAHSPDQQMALARIRQSEALVDRAQAAFWPRLRLTGSYQRGDAPSAYLFSTIDQRSLGNNVNFNQPGTFQNFEAGLGAGWNLYRGGRDLLQRRMAETGLEISRLDRQSVENALVASVIQAYYNALAARDFAAIARDSQKTVGAQLRAMRVRHEAGGALKSDVLSLDVRLASAHESLVRANNNYRLSLAALANLMGADPDAEFTPVECRTPGVKIPPAYRDGLGVALELRPELKKARRQVERARMGLDQAKAGYLPTLDAQGRLYMDAQTPDEFDANKANWVAGLALNWDLFTGFSTPAEVRAASARLERILAADSKATRQVQLEVRSAYLNLEEAKARGRVSTASVRSARESLTLVQRQYDGGAATVTRYLEAELDLSRARQRSAAARYDQAKSEADLARSLGLWARYARQESKDAP